MGIFSSGTFDSAQKWPKSLQKRGKFACKLHNRQLWARLEAFLAFCKILPVINYYFESWQSHFPIDFERRSESQPLHKQSN